MLAASAVTHAPPRQCSRSPRNACRRHVSHRWDYVRLKAQQKAEWIRQQGFVGAAMLPMQELEYSAFRKSLDELERRFTIQ